MTLEVPLSSWRREIVVHHSPGPSAGVKNPVIPYIDRYMVDDAAAAGKQQQVTRLQGLDVERDGAAGGRLQSRGTGKIHTVAAEHVLHEAGAIKPRDWALSAITVTGTQILLGGS